MIMIWFLKPQLLKLATDSPSIGIFFGIFTTGVNDIQNAHSNTQNQLFILTHFQRQLTLSTATKKLLSTTNDVNV